MIQVEELTKRYGDHVAVDSVTFEAPAGSVTGFLGPNGAGKSTCMRMLVGLTVPTQGTARLLGRRYGQLANPATVVGTLLDAGAQHGGRTGRDCLRVQADVLGVSTRRVDEVIERVGLTPKEGRARVGTYSLGMRQRLGLAQALLGDPQVLILDEPANGLDPGGMRWMRDLLRGFADDGGCVLLSSHVLSEVEHVADAYVLIADGRIVRTGRKDEFLAPVTTRVSSVDDPALATALRRAGFQTHHHDTHLVVEAGTADVGAIAFTAGIQLRELSPHRDGLEQTFLATLAQTGGRQREP